ncbi:MAG: glycosyltransferase family 4 protein [Colwellia sp.]|nr:glycosyltransferase family 4 protein [Colwellia sp.]
MNSESGLTVTLVEHIATGHHMEYLLNAISEFDTHNIKIHFVGAPQICEKIKDKVQSVTPLVLDTNCKLVRREFNRITFCKQVFILAKNNNSDLIHFLYVDRLIRALFFSGRQFEIPILATLHWAYMLPSFCQSIKQKIAARFERFLLKKLLKHDVKLIVHSDFIADEINKLEKGSVTAINYPVSEDYKFSEVGRNDIRSKLKLAHDDQLLLCFGGTRYDKGADIAVKLLKNLPNNYHLLIAGKEGDISYETLENIATDNENRLHIMNRFIDDDEVNDIFSAADVLLLLYRPNFSGQSGPLTIAGVIGVPIVATNQNVLSETINKYNLGSVAEASDSVKVLNAIINSRCYCQKDNRRFLGDSSVLKFSQTLACLYREKM